MTKDIVGRLRDVADTWSRELPQAELACIREAADLLETLSPPDGEGLTLETTAEDRRQIGVNYSAWERGTSYVAKLIRDHDTLTAALAYKDAEIAEAWERDDLNTEAASAALAAEKARGDGLAKALRDAKDNGLIYWEPNTERGSVQKALMLARIDAALSVQPRALLSGQQDPSGADG